MKEGGGTFLAVTDRLSRFGIRDSGFTIRPIYYSYFYSPPTLHHHPSCKSIQLCCSLQLRRLPVRAIFQHCLSL